MRVSRGAVAALAVAGLLGVAAGCGGDDDSGEQTDHRGARHDRAAGDDGAPRHDRGSGHAAGRRGGRRGGPDLLRRPPARAATWTTAPPAAGPVPQLAGAGLTEDQIREQVINGGGAMPPGLAQGQDLDNVTAYVLSLQ